MELWGAAIGVAGVVLGGVLTFYFTRSSADREWSRSEAKRLMELRRNAYATYAQVVKEDVRVSRKVAAGLRAANSHHPLSQDEGRLELRDINARRSRALEDVLLVGSKDLILKARVWQHAAWRLRERVLDSPDVESAEFAVFYRKAGKAREDFYNAARKDIDVGGEVSPTPNTELDRYWDRLQ